jgi:transcription initiation factor IIE alpha subunit
MRQTKARKKKPTYCGRTRTAKIRYRTLKDAKGPRSALEKTLQTPVRIYLCPECGGYHLTTQEQWEWGNARTVWKSPDRAVSSENEPDDTEETQNGQDE